MFKFVTLTLLVFSVSGAPYTPESGSQSQVDPDYIAKYKDLTEAGSQSPKGDIPPFEKGHVKYYLYTREVPYAQEIFLDDGGASLYNSSYNPKAVTKILIQDYFSNGGEFVEMMSAYIRDYNQKYVNVLTVKSVHFFEPSYYKFLETYSKIGMAVADMIRYLHKLGAHPDNMHIIGHGFSAHIAAAAASSLLPMKVGRITGLDPAGSEFDRNNSLVQLWPTSADYVDVIYTNMKEIGTERPRGVTRFYPNGGVRQSENDDMFRSHYKSVHYFIESIVTPEAFKAHQANSWVDYLAGKLLGKYEHMGEGTSRRYYGDYYLHVNDYPPYGKDLSPENRTDSTTQTIPESYRLFPTKVDQLPWQRGQVYESVKQHNGYSQEEVHDQPKLDRETMKTL